MSEEEIIYTVKPVGIKSEEKFKQMADEMLANWAEYKKLDTRMKLLDASTKQYMLDNHMDKYESSKGKINIIPQQRRMLNRALIEDIDQYMESRIINISFKSAK